MHRLHKIYFRNRNHQKLPGYLFSKYQTETGRRFRRKKRINHWWTDYIRSILGIKNTRNYPSTYFLNIRLKQEEDEDKSLMHRLPGRAKRKAWRDMSYRWPDKEVPYVIQADFSKGYSIWNPQGGRTGKKSRTPPIHFFPPTPPYPHFYFLFPVRSPWGSQME